LAAMARTSGKWCGLFGYYVKDPQRYGVIEFDKNRKVLSIAEKPKNPKSSYAVTGIYFYDNSVVEVAKSLTPSGRGELEITDINNNYLKRGKLAVTLLGRGHAWLDVGVCDSLIDAGIFVRTLEERQNLKIGCIEEVAYRMGFIDTGSLKKIVDSMNSDYGNYLKNILKDE